MNGKFQHDVARSDIPYLENLLLCFGQSWWKILINELLQKDSFSVAVLS